MSTYLVALVIPKPDSVHVYSSIESDPLTKFAEDNTSVWRDNDTINKASKTPKLMRDATRYFEKLLKIKQPMRKIDYVEDSDADMAMENWGAIMGIRFDQVVDQRDSRYICMYHKLTVNPPINCIPRITYIAPPPISALLELHYSRESYSIRGRAKFEEMQYIRNVSDCDPRDSAHVVRQSGHG